LLSQVKGQSGYSIVELLVAGGLAALIIGLSIQPMVQMKKLEKKVEFQHSLTGAHQMALQKARNSSFIKTRLVNPNSPPEPPGLVEGNTLDRCFGGRGVGCAAVTIPSTTPATIDTFYFSQDGHGATSTVKMWVNCQPTKCGVVTFLVSTLQDGFSSAGALEAQFSIPAAALSSRQEIDFSGCVGKALTGVNYETLTAECVGFTGTKTCSTIPASGPVKTFGDSNLTDPDNCQPPEDLSCPDGMGIVGLIDGQTQCAPPVVCADPMSTACGPQSRFLRRVFRIGNLKRFLFVWDKPLCKPI